MDMDRFPCLFLGTRRFLRLLAIAVGISLPQNILGRIDADRGDVSRSRFLLRIIERVYNTNLLQDERNTSAKEHNGVPGRGKLDV